MGKRILISGHFNVLHPGHIRMFKYAKECAPVLIVAVESDEIAGRAANIREDLRLEGVRANTYVDECFVFNADITEVIERIKPDIVLKGREFEDKFNEELICVKSYGGRLLFSSGESNFNASDLISREILGVKKTFLDMPNAYCKRHQISFERINKILKRFEDLKICVLGDLIVDEYIMCNPLGMSQEDPSIVIAPYDNKMYVGGAAIVACHAASLGANVTFFSVVGNDKTGDWVKSELQRYGVETILLEDETRPTTLKQRYRCGQKTMIRVSHLSQLAISQQLQNYLFEKFEELVEEMDLIVFSDFNYGCLPQKLVDRLTKCAKKSGKIISADSQTSSQIGDVSRFRNTDLLTPTEHEARTALMDNEAGLVILAEKLAQKSNTKNIFLKLGSDGLLVHSMGLEGWQTDRIEALNQNPKDVAGAGDSLLITSSMSLCAGSDVWEAALIGSYAAGLQVSKVGNIPLVMEEIIREMRH